MGPESDGARKAKLLLIAVFVFAIAVLLATVAAALGTLSASGSKRIVPAVQAEQTSKRVALKNTQEEDDMEGQGKVDLDAMKAKLSKEQYAVCFNAATEAPFTGKYWDHHEDGMYHCVACDNPLLASKSKFDSGTGWPSYYAAVEEGKAVTREDRAHGMVRTEVLCGKCEAHLGHLFTDGPQPTGLRYCINSAALEFRAAQPE